MSIQPGTLILDGNYRILHLIGEGRLTRVWLAEETAPTARQVAIKEPRPDCSSGDLAAVARRFACEVDTAAALRRAAVPHVLLALRLAQAEDGVPLLVTEYASGGSLASLLAGYPEGLPIDQALRIARQVCQALAAFHRLPGAPAHQSVKASHILIDTAGEARLSNFGLTCRGEAGAVDAAPGAVDAAPASGRAGDVFAVGAVLFEMLTGRPFAAQAPGTRPGALRPELPAWLDAAVAQAVSGDPWSRTRRAEDLLAALQVGPQAGQTTPVDSAEKARREAGERARQEKLVRLYDALRSAVRARRWLEALRYCDSLDTLDPDYRDVRKLRLQARSALDVERAADEQRQQWQAELDRLYDAVQAAVAARDWAQVVRSCEDVERRQRGYRGVAQIRAQAEARLREQHEADRRQRQHQKLVAQLVWEVEELQNAGKYPAAAAKLVELRRADPTHPSLYPLERRVRTALVKAPGRRFPIVEWSVLALLLIMVGVTLGWGIAARRTPEPAVPASVQDTPIQVPVEATAAEVRLVASPTAGLQPAPKVAAAPATATPRPRATATRGPTRTPVPTGTASPTRAPSTPTQPVIGLGEPANGSQLSGLVLFRWTGTLGPGEVFDVRVCGGAACTPRFGKTNTTDTGWTWCPDGDLGIYRWQVVVIDDATKADRGPASGVREFTWLGGCGPKDSQGDPAYPAPGLTIR